MIYVDDMPGANDDERFENALTTARLTNGFTDTVIFGPRSYTLAQTHTLRSGDQISGTPGSADEVRSTGNKNRIVCKQAGNVFTISANFTHSIYIGNLQFNGTPSTTWFGSVPGIGLQTCHFENLGFSNFGGVFGNSKSNLEMTACLANGWFNINASKDTCVNIAGSDNNLFLDGLLLDGGPDNLGFTGNKYLMRLQYLEASVVGPIYITAETNSGLRIDSYGAGSTKLANLVFPGGARIAGRNPSKPALGAAIRIKGGVGSIRDLFTGNAMSNPSATGLNDLGVIHVDGGEWLFDGVTYQRATSVPETTPLFYVAAGAVLRVRNVRRSGAWAGKPVVTGPGSISADDTVKVI